MNKVKIEYFGENKEEKIWSVWGDSFGEINSYLLDFESAKQMAEDVLAEGEFEDVSVYCPKTAEERAKNRVIRMGAGSLKEKTNFESATKSLADGKMLLLKGSNVVGSIDAGLEYPFTFDVYNIETEWDENLKEFDEEFLLDGGVLEEDNPAEALKCLLDLMREQSLKLDNKEEN